MFRVRQLLLLIVSTIAVSSAPVSASPSDACPDTAGGFPTSRIVELDAVNGPIFGVETRRHYEPSFLKPKEVVLTFDDGPLPLITRSILKTLKSYCAHATFFSVGEMALAFPEVVKETLAAGHTLASHTMTHPFNMHRMFPGDAHDEIDRGFAAITAAAGQPIAPFFRFPGLSDSNDLLNFLRDRKVAAFTVDVISNDSYATSAAALTHNVLNLVEQTQGGIILFHDIKKATAEALPAILKGLKARGFTLVHMRAKSNYDVPKSLRDEMQLALAAEHNKRGIKYGPLSVASATAAAVEPPKLKGKDQRLARLDVSSISPPLRERAPSNDIERAKPPKAKAVAPVEQAAAKPATASKRNSASKTKKGRLKRRLARADP